MQLANTVTNAKSAAISFLILQEMAAGKDVRQAIDAVCGAGTCAKLIEDVYYACRAKAEAIRAAAK